MKRINSINDRVKEITVIICTHQQQNKHKTQKLRKTQGRYKFVDNYYEICINVFPGLTCIEHTTILHRPHTKWEVNAFESFPTASKLTDGEGQRWGSEVWEMSGSASLSRSRLNTLRSKEFCSKAIIIFIHPVSVSRKWQFR